MIAIDILGIIYKTDKITVKLQIYGIKYNIPFSLFEMEFMFKG